jgi:hypothetical protein
LKNNHKNREYFHFFMAQNYRVIHHYLTERLMANLPVAFNGFAEAKSQIFSVRSAGHLDIDAACPVAIIPGDQNIISVEIDADPKDVANFDVWQEGDKISVHQKGTGGVFVFIDGKEVKQGQQDASTSTKTPCVIIRAPANGNLDAEMSGASVLLSAIRHDKAYLNLSGQVWAGVAAKTMNVNASGRSEVHVYVDGGKLDVDLSQRSSLQARGNFAKVKADLSGMGSLKTIGTVSGNYTAEASGMGSIVHRGQIKGRIRRDSSGMARIDLG